MQRILLLCLFLGTISSACNQQTQTPPEEKQPNDYLYQQRAFPYGTVPSEAYYSAVEWAQSQAQQRNDQQWELAGPANVGGRITDIAMHPSDLQTIYVASASGGVWKSADAGQSWFSITDNLPSLSIGDIAIDPSDKNTLYCGTGEPNGGGGSVTYDGRGLFKSNDGGANWSALGLENTGSIGRIEVDPENPERIFVAAMGHLFENNSERGLFRSEDGGATWTRQLFINDSTGVIDLAIHPLDPDTLFAVAWERVRRPAFRRYGGPGCGIYRSTNGGDSWVKIAGGFPQNNVGRIGIALAPGNPDVLYATVADETGYFKNTYKSLDLGDSWTPMSGQSNPNYSSYGWWFGQIRVHPTDAKRVYNFGIDLRASNNGGSSWYDLGGSMHVDHHALYIHPVNPDFMVEGNDGGVYISQNGGLSWSFRSIPVTQFYTSEIDFQKPERLYGGAQDNGTWRATDPNPDIWEHIYGGDGFVTLVNPTNSAIWYAEYQYGGFGGSNGATRPPFTRANWNAPYVFDPNNPDILYFGGESLFKSVDRGLTWTYFSGEMTTSSGSNGVVYGTISAIAISPVDGGVVWVGTDDGKVWMTPNGGNIWKIVSAALPRRWVTRVVADPADPAAAWVCLSGYKHGDAMAHIYRTADAGQSWTPVSGNLPDIPVNDLILDPLAPGTLIAATDAGVFISYDNGANWTVLGAGLPNVPVLDLTLHAPTRALVAATFGRSMFRTYLPLPVGTNNPKTEPLFAVFPNPARDVLHLQAVQAGIFQVFDLSGKLIFSKKMTGQEGRIEINVANWPAGVYLFLLNGQSRKVAIMR
ncbi:MAG: T9SS type A sorting domain-containing protein [Lewinellaceae bacterium]|nr:T9SS type A sorting domain-containing protein [Saprospiraceae bacterium]MCB9331867.1 T9SS type A sorting domain-containing protein [Lewinellaceae bacterium]